MISRRISRLLFILSFIPFAFPQGELKLNFYGTIKTYWVIGKGNYSSPYPSNTASPLDKSTSFYSYPGTTTIGFSLQKGETTTDVEIDFEGDGYSPLLLKACLTQPLKDNLQIVIGRADPVGELNSFSDNYVKMPGFNPAQAWGVDQIRFEITKNKSGCQINQAFAIGNLMEFFYGDDEPVEIRAKNPALSYKLSIEFASSLRLYTFYESQRVNLSDGNNFEEATPRVFGAGFQMPLKSLQIQGEIVKGKGTTFYAGLVGTDSDIKIPSAFKDIHTPRCFKVWNLEMGSPLNKKSEIYAGFARTIFSGAIGESEIEKGEGYFLGIAYQLSNSTILKLEYDSFRTGFIYSTGSLNWAKAHQWFLSTEYSF